MATPESGEQFQSPAQPTAQSPAQNAPQPAPQRTTQPVPATGGKRPLIPAPTGTRDFYPADLARRRYVEGVWRSVSLRHGFDEIDGPTFEHLELYTIKSGDGIISELFSFTRAGGEKDYALRPEFTPTLARLYAAKGATLPKPTKWFWQQTCFRAERPQRGRLREFVQWNVDHLGDEDKPRADFEIIACCIDALATLGLTSADLKVHISDRNVISALLAQAGVNSAAVDAGAALALLDKRVRLKPEIFAEQAAAIALDVPKFDSLASQLRDPAALQALAPSLAALMANLTDAGLADWCIIDPAIARGLAYYTGVVFEVLVGGERAVAGGGRYDNLIELFGGPPTPGVGFGMGDVVLALVLQDKGLMPDDKAIAQKLGLAPDVYVISNGTPEADTKLVALLAALRTAGKSARRTYKATKNVGKLLKDANDSGAKFAVIIESGSEATVKNLATGTQEKVAIEDVVSRVSVA